MNDRGLILCRCESPLMGIAAPMALARRIRLLLESAVDAAERAILLLPLEDTPEAESGIGCSES